MRKCKTAALVLLICMATAVFTGCTTFDNFKTAFIDKPEDNKAAVHIGVFEPVTGADSENADLEIKGIELAHEMYPTVNGKFVELEYADNASDIYAAETAIKELVHKKPSVILGSYGSVYSLMAGDTVKEAEIPAIAISNMNPLVTANNDYYFRVCYVESDQGDILARYVLEQKKEKTAGVLLPKQDDAAMAMATAFTDRIKAETNNADAIAVYEEYEHGDDDFSKQLSAVQESGVKSVILPGAYEDSVKIIRQASQMGIDAVFLGDRNWGSSEFRNLADGIATEENTAFVNFYSAEEPVNREAEIFLKAYHEKYGQDSVPDDLTALGYDAYILALNAVDKADENASGKEIKDILKKHNEFKGVSGTISFNSKGDPIKTGYISTWKGDEMITLHTIEPI